MPTTVAKGEKIALGDWIYVWSAKGGTYPAAAQGEQLMISSHGIQTRDATEFDIPRGYELKFYTPDGEILRDPGFKSLGKGKVKVEEVCVGTSRNYDLGKYQGRHNKSNVETYEEIQEYLANSSEEVQQWREVMEKFERDYENREMDPTARHLYNQAKNRVQAPVMDILTIRNRKGKGAPPTFKKVLEKLDSEGYAYRTIHCSFCRGTRR